MMRAAIRSLGSAEARFLFGVRGGCLLAGPASTRRAVAVQRALPGFGRAALVSDHGFPANAILTRGLGMVEPAVGGSQHRLHAAETPLIADADADGYPEVRMDGVPRVCLDPLPQALAQCRGGVQLRLT